MAAMRAERFVRKGGFDVLHLHEPLAPVAAYGFVASAPLPMVGTYHRAGVSRWVPVLKPLVYLVGSRLQVRVAVSEAARETALRSSKGRVRGALQRRGHGAVHPWPTRCRRIGPPSCSWDATRRARVWASCSMPSPCSTARPCCGWPATGRRARSQRRRHPESDRVNWLGILSDREVDARLVGADVLCAPSLRGESFGMVVLEGMAARCAVVASDLQGYRSAAGGHAVLVPPGDVDRACRGPSAWRWPTRPRGAGSRRVDALKAAEAHAQGWSMESLAERYVDVYERAIAAYRRGEHSYRPHTYTRDVLTVIGPSGGTGTVHDGGDHPERPARIDAVMAGVADLAPELGSDLEIVGPVRADVAALERVHAAGLPAASGGVLLRRGRPPRPRHLRPARLVGGRVALGRGGTAGHRRAAPTRRRRGVRGHPASGSSCPGRSRHGLLPAEQRGGGGGRAGGGGRTGADRRLGRAPRQRDAGHLLGRPVRALRLHPPVARSIRAPGRPTRWAGARRRG